MIQPSRSQSAFSVTAGSVLPCSSCPRLPIGSATQSIARPLRDAAAFITLTHSGTTSSPMSSPGRTPIFKRMPLGLPRPEWARRVTKNKKGPGLPQEVVELRMLAHVGRDEGALGGDLEPLRASPLEHAAHEGRTDAASPELRRDFGVDQRDDPRRQSVVEDSRVAIDIELEAVERGVVADAAGHGAYSAGCSAGRAGGDARRRAIRASHRVT